MPNGVKDALMNKMTFSNVRLVDLKNLIVGEKWPTLEKGWGFAPLILMDSLCSPCSSKCAR